MSQEREKALQLQKKIKALETRIDQKNSLLTSLKQTEQSNDEKLRSLKAQNEVKLKSLNHSISRLKQENTLLKSSKAPSLAKYYFPPISQPSRGNKAHSRNVSAGPRLQKSSRKDSPFAIEEDPAEENNEKSLEINNDHGSNVNVSNLTKQTDILRRENERLKKKIKQVGDKYHTEVSSKERELLELRKLKIDLGSLREKFEILSRKNKTYKDKENGEEGRKGGVKDENLMFLSKRVAELHKEIQKKIQENEGIKDEVNKFKIKARALIAEKKKAMEQKDMVDSACQCGEEDCGNARPEADLLEKGKEGNVEQLEDLERNRNEGQKAEKLEENPTLGEGNAEILGNRENSKDHNLEQAPDSFVYFYY